MKRDKPMKGYIVATGKFLLAIVIIAWVVKSGRMSARNLQGAFARPSPLLLGMSLVALIMLLSAVRWHYLLKMQGIFLKFSETLTFSLIGNFFSTVIPGAVSGDVVKAYYVSSKAKNRKAAIIFTVGADRFLGLISLIIMALAAIALDRRKIFSVPQLKYMAEVILCSSACVAATLFFIFLRWGRDNSRIFKFLSKMPFARAIDGLLGALRRVKALPRFWLAITGASLLILLLLGMSLYLFGVSLGMSRIALSEYFFAAPFIILSMAIPITPSGIGVGQVVSMTIMDWIQGGQSTFGADMVTLLQFSRIFVALCGALVYIRFRRDVDTSCLLESGGIAE